MVDLDGFADFREGAVKPPRQPKLVAQIQAFLQRFPEAAMHREALQLLGSDWVYAAPDQGNPDCWVIYIRFGTVIERLFDLTREIVCYYSPYADLQIRTFDRLDRVVQSGARTVTPDFRALYSRDPDLQKKLADWSRGAVTTLPMDLAASDAVEAAAELFLRLTTKLSTRDLYYETLPVTGEDFFGRRLTLLSLLRDIRERRVCGVFGLRKSGKTSIVKEVLDELDTNADPWALAFVDLESLPSPPSDPIPELLRKVTAALIDALQPHQLRTHELRQMRSTSTLDDFAQAVQASLADADRKSIRVLLALDEIEFLLASDLSDHNRAPVAQFLALLRSAVQEHPSFLTLLSGVTSAIVEEGTLFGRPNPFYSWAKPYFVAPLDPDEASNLVTTLGRRVALTWSDEAVDMLYTATDGHAFYLRALASFVTGKIPMRQRLFRVEPERVQAALPTWRRATAARVREVFETLEVYYPDERTLLDIALDSPEDLADIALEHPTEIEHLLQLGLLKEDPTSGGLAVGALPRLGPRRTTL
jgi:hypothetical protein